MRCASFFAGVGGIDKGFEEAKKIASEARERLKSLCPALIQRAINS